VDKLQPVAPKLRQNRFNCNRHGDFFDGEFQMTVKIEGIIPVMLTPFTDQGEINYPGLERLIEWYLEKGADALFAIAQSSEMQLAADIAT
jgi:Dihydrodipicolinate synthetase family